MTTSQQLRVSVIQMDIAIGEPDRNYEQLNRLMQQAMEAEQKPDVLICPEMWNTGYALDRIQQLADPDGSRTIEMIAAFSRKHSVNVIAGSIAEKVGADVRNTIYAFDRNGNVNGSYSKIHLFRLMDEEKHLQAGDQLGTLELDSTPVGAMICYDIRFPELSRKLALSGAKVLFVPAEWPHPRLHHWRTLLMARAIENQMYVVACNRVGRSGNTDFFGHSMIIDPWGEVIAEGDESERILSADLNLGLVDKVRATIPVFQDRRPELYV